MTKTYTQAAVEVLGTQDLIIRQNPDGVSKVFRFGKGLDDEEILQSEYKKIFNLFNSTEWQNPPPSTDPLDYPLDPIQFEAILRYLGFTKDQLEGYIEHTVPDGLETRYAAIAKMRNSNTYRRDHPLFGIVSAAVDLTSEEVDEAWIKASKIQ